MKTILLSGAAMLALVSGQALAQTQPVTPSPSAAPSTAGQSTANQLAAIQSATPADPRNAELAADAGTGLEDIIVTAQRRSESLQRAALPISAVGSDALVAASLTEPSNLTKLVPSLVVQPSGGSGVNVYLRGVGTLQSNAFAENPVAFNFNGVYIARPTAPVGSFYDIDRLEVVKGPQGTLYGRNATGGAINVLPAKPVIGKFGGNAVAEYANYDSKKVSAAINLPVGDTLALRIAGQVVDRDGYLSDGYDDEKGQALRGSLLLDTGNGWSALLVADWFHQGGKGIGSVLSPTTSVPAPPLSDRVGGSDPRSIGALQSFASTQFAPPFCGGLGGFLTSGCVAPPRNDGYIDSTFWGASLIVEGDLGFATLTVQPAYRNSKPEFRFYLPGFRGEVSEQDDQMSLEVRLASKGRSALGYVVGAYYFTEDQVASNYFYQGTLSTTRFTPRLTTESRAVFGQATLSLADTFRIVGGARYTDETKSQSTRLASGGLPGTITPPLGDAITGRQNFSKVTWKGGIEWDAAPASLVYASVSTGFKAGGFYVATPPNNSFRPENLIAYTVGAKNRFLDNRLQINLEAFYWDYTDQQISFVGGITTPNGVAPGSVTVNAGRARMYGAEAEIRFALTPNDRFGADVQYLNGRYNALAYSALSASGAPIRTGCAVNGSRLANPGTPSTARLFDLDCGGRPTINSPKWTANLSYDHTFLLGGGLELVAGADTRLESSRFVTIDYLPETRQGAYMMSDASLTLSGDGGRWSLAGFVNNIENKTVLAGATSRPVLQTVYSVLRPPRTYGGRVRFKF